MRDGMTLSKSWTSPWGFTFPAGTVLLLDEQRTRRCEGARAYVYVMPHGGQGDVLVDDDTPIPDDFVVNHDVNLEV